MDIKIKGVWTRSNHKPFTPKGIEKSIRARLVEKEEEEEKSQKENIDFLLQMAGKDVLLPDEREALIKDLTHEMKQAAKELDFETATILRDRIKLLKKT